MENDRTESKGIKSNDTLFTIIEFLRENDGAGVTELAAGTGLSKSTVHGHLTSLRDRGFVVKRDGQYRLGLQFFDYGQYVRNQYDIYGVARDLVDELAAETGEIAGIVTEESGKVVYLYGRGGETDINLDSIIGSALYMHQNSGGKAILAHLPESEVEAIIDRHGLPGRTENTITTREDLYEELERTRERGYALNLSEDLEGIHAVGVPLIHDGTVRGALTIAGPSYRVTRERCETALAERLHAATDDIELALTYK
jgi:DNA-binding IclR family transcriptional regulator